MSISDQEIEMKPSAKLKGRKGKAVMKAERKRY